MFEFINNNNSTKNVKQIKKKNPQLYNCKKESINILIIKW